MTNSYNPLSAPGRQEFFMVPCCWSVIQITKWLDSLDNTAEFSDQGRFIRAYQFAPFPTILNDYRFKGENYGADV